MTDEAVQVSVEGSGEAKGAAGEGRRALVTGASSLLGRLVVSELLRRGVSVVVLLRRESKQTLEGLERSLEGEAGGVKWGSVEELRGDLWEPDLGLGSKGLERLREVTEIFHLGRPRATERPLIGALVQGHERVIDVARRLTSLRRLVVLSTLDVAGDFRGRFYEDWLDVGQRLPTQRSREAVEAETRLREAAEYLPVCIVRHGLLVGHSRTGQMECEAGFERLLSLCTVLSRLPDFVRLPVPATEERFVTVTPIDFLAEALVEIGFADDVRPGETFCVADPKSPSLEELYDLLLRRCGGPPAGVRVPLDGKGVIGRAVGLVAGAGAALGTSLGSGPGVLAYLTRRGDHDMANADRVLGRAGLRCPSLETYFDALYEGHRRRVRRREEGGEGRRRDPRDVETDGDHRS